MTGARRAATSRPEPKDLGRELSELIGAVGIYLGEIGSAHIGDKERLRRAMKRALRAPAFVHYMESSNDEPVSKI